MFGMLLFGAFASPVLSTVIVKRCIDWFRTRSDMQAKSAVSMHRAMMVPAVTIACWYSDARGLVNISNFSLTPDCVLCETQSIIINHCVLTQPTQQRRVHRSCSCQCRGERGIFFLPWDSQCFPSFGGDDTSQKAGCSLADSSGAPKVSASAILSQLCWPFLPPLIPCSLLLCSGPEQGLLGVPKEDGYLCRGPLSLHQPCLQGVHRPGAQHEGVYVHAAVRLLAWLLVRSPGRLEDWAGGGGNTVHRVSFRGDLRPGSTLFIAHKQTYSDIIL